MFDNPTKWFEDNNEQEPSKGFSTGLKHVLTIAYPKLTNEEEFYNIIWKDLERAGMHNTGSLQTRMSANGLMQSRTTVFGKNFLKFISKN